MGTLAGMLAGMIIGSNSSNDSNSNPGTTLIAGSLAIGQTAMLAFTRENETEADEKGIMFLKKSCFSPEGLLLGLTKIRESDVRGTEGIPEYIKTHPGTGNRIAHVETILSGYVPEKNKAKCKQDFRFDMVKYRLLGLYADIEPTFARLTRELKDNPSNAAVQYGMGLLYARKFRTDEALVHLKKALSINIFDPMILLELGRIYQENGDAEKALNVLKSIESEPVLGVMAKFYQASAHLELQNITEAEELFNFVINTAADSYPMAYYKLANIKSIQKEPALSHYYLGVYYSEINNTKTAIVHLNKALKGLSDGAKSKKAKALLDQLLKKEKESQKK